jgi:hypothetical protein
VTFARERSFEREAVTDERALFRDALRRGMGETTYAQVRASVEQRLASGEFQLVIRAEARFRAAVHHGGDHPG